MRISGLVSSIYDHAFEQSVLEGAIDHLLQGLRLARKSLTSSEVAARAVSHPSPLAGLQERLALAVTRARSRSTLAMAGLINAFASRQCAMAPRAPPGCGSAYFRKRKFR